MNKLTMQDIAHMAGVSLATVSRAIHAPHLVRPKTRERVLKIIKENNYVYHAAAADLSRNKSSVIGVLIPTTKAPVFAGSTLAIQEMAQQRGYSIIMGNTRYDAQIESTLLRQMQERRLAGVILTGFTFDQEASIKELVKSGIPCIVIWEKLDDPTLSYVGFDNFKAAHTVTEYLIGLGHRRIGLIIGPYTRVGRVKKRFQGYSAALREHGIPLDPSLILENEPTLAQGKQSMAKLLSLRDPPTAVFAASDVLAIGAMAAARERGLKIPHDVSIAGFDDLDFSAFCNPPLTTIRVPAQEIGQLAAKVLLEMIEQESLEPRQYCLDTKLIIRESCRPYGGLNR